MYEVVSVKYLDKLFYQLMKRRGATEEEEKEEDRS
jgi:hypothetical protein